MEFGKIDAKIKNASPLLLGVRCDCCKQEIIKTSSTYHEVTGYYRDEDNKEQSATRRFCEICTMVCNYLEPDNGPGPDEIAEILICREELGKYIR